MIIHSRRLYWVISVVISCSIPLIAGCGLVTPAGPTVSPTSTCIAGACTPIPGPTQIDRGLLYNEPCAPPCWEGIIPGISSQENVVEVLLQLEEEQRIKAWEKITDTYYAAYFPVGGTLDVDFVDGIVQELSIFYWTSFDFRVHHVIDRFGEPEAYYAPFGKPESQYSCADWEEYGEGAWHHTTSGYLIYPSLGVTVLISIPPGYEGSVCPEMETLSFRYYEPRSLSAALQESRSPALGRRDLSSEDLVPWQGYDAGY